MKASIAAGQWLWAIVMAARRAAGRRIPLPGAGSGAFRGERAIEEGARSAAARASLWLWRLSPSCSPSRRRRSSAFCRSAVRPRALRCNERAGATVRSRLLVAALAAPLVVLAACPRAARSAHWRARSHGSRRCPRSQPACSRSAARRSAAELPALRVSFWLDQPAGCCSPQPRWSGSSSASFALREGQGRPNADRFAVSWLLTMAGSLGVFIAADLLTFYLVYALVSIPAYYLVAHDGEASSRRAGGVYLAFALLGEAVLLIAFVMLAAGEPSGSVQIRDVVAALPASPWRDAALALIIIGFGMKIALVPLHGWMPLTYTAAPIPAAAVLSGAAVKAGVIGLIRFLPLGAAFPGWGEALVWVGFISAFYGVAIGVTQRDPKTMLAYSSVSQMGVIAAALGMALASARQQGAATKVAFYAANHVLVKAALFLTVGVAAALDGRARTLALIMAALLGLSLAGLPLTGGALAKLAVKDLFGDGAAGVAAQLSAAATTALMLMFVMRLARSPREARRGRRPRASGLGRRWRPPHCSSRGSCSPRIGRSGRGVRSRQALGRNLADAHRRRGGRLVYGPQAIGSAHSRRRHHRRRRGCVQRPHSLSGPCSSRRIALAGVASGRRCAAGDRACARGRGMGEPVTRLSQANVTSPVPGPLCYGECKVPKAARQVLRAEGNHGERRGARDRPVRLGDRRVREARRPGRARRRRSS